MSETNETKEPYDESLVFLQDEASVEEHSRPKHLDAIFEEARLWQSRHEGYSFASHQEASQKMRQVAEYFDTSIQSKGIIGNAVILRGVGVQAPRAVYNEVTGQFIVEPMPVEELRDDLSMGAEVNGVNGGFAGFGYRLIECDQGTNDIDDAASTRRYKGMLLYQVATRDVSHSQGYTQLFATGNVHDTYLEFVDDIKKQQLDVIIEGLLTIDSLSTAQQINELHVLLFSEIEWEEKLPEIVDLTSKIAGSADFKDDLVKQDLLIDLLGHYLNPQGTYTIAAQDAILLVNGKKVSKASTDEAPITVNNQKISGIVLGNAYRRDNGKFIMSRSRHVPYFVVETSDQVLHIAMDRLLKFQTGE